MQSIPRFYNQARHELNKARSDILALETTKKVVHRNTLRDEPVVAHIELYPNKQIFAKDETITQRVLDLDQSRENIESAVLKFLQEVNSIAVAKGVLPDPLKGTVGPISGAELFATVNQLQRQVGIIRLTAIAVSETSIAGPLEIKIIVEHL